MTIHELEAAARREFGFLETEFGCALERVEEDNWWRRLIYSSNTGRAEIYLDERDEIVSVYVGAAGEDPLPLWAILDARGEPQPQPDTNVEAWADALRRHGAEALRGDTSGYTGIDEAIERRGAAWDRAISERLDELRAEREAGGPLRRALERIRRRIP